MLERYAIEKLHGDEGLAVLFADVVDRANVWVIEGGSSLGFAAETLDCDGVVRGTGREKFKSDGGLEGGVFGFVDDTHAAAPELLEDAIVRNCLAEHWPSRPVADILDCGQIAGQPRWDERLTDEKGRGRRPGPSSNLFRFGPRGT